MGLKRYQERVIRKVKRFLEALAKEQAAGNRYASLAAWDDARAQFLVVCDYHQRRNDLVKDLPTFYINPGVGARVLPSHILSQYAHTFFWPKEYLPRRCHQILS